MDFKKYFATRPYLVKQFGITAFSIAAVTVTLIENKIEAEHRFYRDDLPAHTYFYEPPLTSGGFVAATNSSLALNMYSANLL